MEVQKILAFALRNFPILSGTSKGGMAPQTLA
jgi:hypothetical protein